MDEAPARQRMMTPEQRKQEATEDTGTHKKGVPVSTPFFASELHFVYINPLRFS